MNLPVQDLIRLKWFFGRYKNLKFKNKKSHVDKIYNFQLLAHFLTDSESPEIKYFKSGSKYSYMFV